MTLPESEQPDQMKVEVESACGGRMRLAEDTPRAAYNGSDVYFCMEECKVLFENDPWNSCLEDRIRLHVG